MADEENWYSFWETRTSECKSIKTICSVLEIKKLVTYLKETSTCTREYYTSKYSVFQVPESQFQLKLVFLGTYVEIYWRTLRLSEFIELSLETSVLPYSSRYDNKTVIDFAWIRTNKWHNCGYISHPYGGLRLIFTFQISLTAKENNAPTPTTLQQLKRDFENLLTNNDDSNYDVTIKSVDGEEFKLHKIILDVRCKVLKAHFEHNTEESATNIVETPWEAKVLRDVVSFIYTGSAPGINDDPEKVLAAADFYQLEGLKSLCAEKMIEMLTVENAIRTLQVALLHSVDTLRDETLEFIKDGHARLITETEAWANVSSDIVKIIYEFITADEKISYNIITEAYKEYNSKYLQN